MIEELRHQELQNFTEPSVELDKYYAVELQRRYYFGHALTSPNSVLIDFKFLHATVCVSLFGIMLRLTFVSVNVHVGGP